MTDSSSVLALTKLWRGSTLKLNLCVARHIINNNLEKTTELIDYDDLAQVIIKCKDINSDVEVSLKVRKHEKVQPGLKFSIDINSTQFEKTLYYDDWVEIPTVLVKSSSRCELRKNYDCTITCIYTIEVNITLVGKMPLSFFLPNNELHEDTQLTDFELLASDGSVAVHKAILYSHSQMFRTMLTRDWKETSEGRIKIDGVTVQTLQLLKDYMYLGTLPEEGLEQLLSLAVYYFMDKLKEDCISKLVMSVKVDNVDSLIELACLNNIPDLMRAILFKTPDHVVNGAYKLKKNESKPADAADEK